MTKNIIVLFLLCCFGVHAQKKVDFGKLTQADRDFKIFEKDTSAAAVYLYEFGDNYFEVRNDYIKLITVCHTKIKILKEEGFDQATIEIPYYHTEKRSEKIQKIKAITHNETGQNRVLPSEIFDIDESERWSEKRFTFPNVKVGSVLEYSYEIESPFFFNLKGWGFQDDIPKVYSEYNAKIPGNWVYNRSLIGEIPLDTDEATVEKHCFSLPGAGEDAGCEVLKYAMKEVPAFAEDEAFMLSGKNYRSRLEFELSEYHSFYGRGTEEYTKTWKDVDAEFRSDKDIGRQLRKKNFFENNVSEQLLTEGDDLTRAKNIYSFVQNHFSWNKKYGIWRDNSVKQAFEGQKGNVAEINITLINLLNAAGLKADMMLTATRGFGLPKKSHPVMSDFNYIIAKVDIEGKSYLLDATDKNVPFGILPFRCLNYYGRVMDFKKESYWFDIVPEEQNRRTVRVQMKLNLEEGKVQGIFNSISTGYQGFAVRKSLNSLSEEEYIDEVESDAQGEFLITAHRVVDEHSDEKKLVQRFDFEVENVFQKETVYLNPFIIKFFDENPFKASERNYPIDFGYKRRYDYTMNIKIPEGYGIKNLPDNNTVVLPGNAGSLRFECKKNADVLTVFFDFRLNATQYKSNAYKLIKDFFALGVETQTKSYIALEKV